MKKNIIYTLICVVFIGGSSLLAANAQEKASLQTKEPMMEYKYNLEEQRIKRAQFIWKSCMEELTKDGTLTNDDVKNVNVYLSQKMKSDRFEAPMKKYDKQKKALRPITIEQMVSDKVLTLEQAEKLREKLNCYKFPNLEQ